MFSCTFYLGRNFYIWDCLNCESFLANYGKEGNSRNFSSADDSHYTVLLPPWLFSLFPILCSLVTNNDFIQCIITTLQWNVWKILVITLSTASCFNIKDNVSVSIVTSSDKSNKGKLIHTLPVKVTDAVKIVAVRWTQETTPVQITSRITPRYLRSYISK